MYTEHGHGERLQHRCLKGVMLPKVIVIDDRLEISLSTSPALLDARVPTLRNHLSSTAMRLHAG